jgi:DEAD/DEAH box helicase domain-containing protein
MYDGYEGGIGLTKAVIRSAHEWIRSGIEVIEQCPCDGGCPSCIQDPQCGSGNEPLDKQGALSFLKRLRG